MSANFVEELFTSKLKKQLDHQKGREAQQDITGQLYIINREEFQKLIDHLLEVEKREGAPVSRASKADVDTMVKVARHHAFNLEKQFIALKSTRIPENRKFPALKASLVKRLGPQYEVLGSNTKDRDVFLVQYFRSKPKDNKFGIDKIKNALYKYLGVKAQERRVLYEHVSERKQKDFTPGGTAFQNAQEYLDKGHGGQGLAVSTTQSAIALGAIQETFGVSDEAIDRYLEDVISNNLLPIKITGEEASIIQKIRVAYKQIVDTNTGTGLIADYVAAVELEFFADNTLASEAEKNVKKLFRNQIGPALLKELVDTPGSSTLREKVNKAILVDAFIKQLNTGDVTIKVSPKLLKGGNKSIGNFTVLGKKDKTKIAIGKEKPTRLPRKRKRGSTSSSAVNLKTLIPLINKVLPQTIIGNMGFPALENRTGRFARSAQVVDITRTAKGYPSIAYTYQRNPYQVFEYPGGDPNRATTDRDPRKIIDQSIREIATGLMRSRFYTRRV